MPADTPLYGGIHADFPSSFPDHIVNAAVIAPSAGVPYEFLVYAGAQAGNPQQGITIVVRMDEDPCLPSAKGTIITRFDTSYQQGALTLRSMTGSMLAYTTATGTVGHFDYLTGVFL